MSKHCMSKSADEIGLSDKQLLQAAYVGLRRHNKLIIGSRRIQPKANTAFHYYPNGFEMFKLGCSSSHNRFITVLP